MVIPQLNGTVKGFLAVAALGMGTALVNSWHNGVLTGWGDLPSALNAGSFQGFMAFVVAGVAWLTLRSPASQTTKDEKNLLETVKATTGTTGKQAEAVAAQVKAMATDTAIQTLVTGTGDGRALNGGM